MELGKNSLSSCGLLNKRGMFFTILALVILSLFLLTYGLVSKFGSEGSEHKRVETLDKFVSSAERDMPRLIGIAGFRIIFLLEKEVVEKGQYVADLNASFNEAFFNGTIDGESQQLMIGMTYDGIQDFWKEQAAKINANFSIRNPKISISHADPWNMKVSLNANFVYEDLNGLVLWNKTSAIESLVPIENFNDPLYLIKTNSQFSNKMSKTPYKVFVSGNDITNLSSHAENSYYVESSTGPSFLDRLQGINAPSAYGVESLVNLQKLSSYGFKVLDKSVVDYIYFSDNNPPSCAVKPAGMPSWFKLDNAHLAKYQVQCA